MQCDQNEVTRIKKREVQKSMEKRHTMRQKMNPLEKANYRCYITRKDEKCQHVF